MSKSDPYKRTFKQRAQLAISEFDRLIIRSDFRRADSIVSVAGEGGVSYDRPLEYLEAGRWGRFGKRAWRWFVVVMFGSVTLMLLFGWLTGAFLQATWWQQIFLVFFLLYALWTTAISVSFLRWMYRHRRDPKR